MIPRGYYYKISLYLFFFNSLNFYYFIRKLLNNPASFQIATNSLGLWKVMLSFSIEKAKEKQNFKIT
jgi:hypothetical protein